AKPVAKFADRATAERRTWQALTTTDAPASVPPTTTTETTDMATKTAPRKRTPSKTRTIAEKKIYKLVKENPRRANTWGHKSFAKIRDGMTVEQYLAAGGRRNDLAWDLAHKYVELR
ncbi:MAG TPA: hypothetical protein VFA43_21370, partial [Gemmatimonadaceae bacterium]|nr:hypothetical protein [Gemmatimonadaceae bacterium]